MSTAHAFERPTASVPSPAVETLVTTYVGMLDYEEHIAKKRIDSYLRRRHAEENRLPLRTESAARCHPREQTVTGGLSVQG